MTITSPPNLLPTDPEKAATSKGERKTPVSGAIEMVERLEAYRRKKVGIPVKGK